MASAASSTVSQPKKQKKGKGKGSFEWLMNKLCVQGDILSKNDAKDQLLLSLSTLHLGLQEIDKDIEKMKSHLEILYEKNAALHSLTSNIIECLEYLDDETEDEEAKMGISENAVLDVDYEDYEKYDEFRKEHDPEYDILKADKCFEYDFKENKEKRSRTD
jgi:hypothetical protein